MCEYVDSIAVFPRGNILYEPQAMFANSAANFDVFVAYGLCLIANDFDQVGIAGSARVGSRAIDNRHDSLYSPSQIDGGRT